MSKKKATKSAKSKPSFANAPWLPDLKHFISIPSISTDSAYREYVKEASLWLKEKLMDMGFKVSMLGTKKHPAVFAMPKAAKYDASKKTILIYGHYDVQPASQHDGWLGDPFVPRITNGKLIARGATDNKGQIFGYLEAVRQLVKEGVELPVNIAFLIEGEEEIGSPNLKESLSVVKERVNPSAVFLSDTTIPSLDQPALTYSCRGLINFEINIRTAEKALHSGVFGGAVANPAQEIAEIIAKLKDDQGRITIPGVYDDVRPVEKWERESWKTLPIDDASIEKDAGVMALVGEPEFSGVERLWVRPSLDVNGLLAGYIGEGAKTEISATSMAKLSMRLVPDQDPKKMEKCIRKFIKEITPSHLKLDLDFIAACTAFHTNPQSEMMAKAEKALENVFGNPPVKIREGGSIPVLPDFAEVFQCDLVLAGFAVPDCGAHSKEEYMPLILVEKLVAYFRDLVLNQFNDA